METEPIGSSCLMQLGPNQLSLMGHAQACAAIYPRPKGAAEPLW
jgi:hypothetical protein